jgi:drug/metabolite transporter (DMT)-like permease
MKKDIGGARPVLATLLGAALIGLAPIGIRFSELEPVATNFWRFAFALPVLLVWARPGRVPDRRPLAWLTLAGGLFALELNLWAVALTLTTVANATLLANMTPVVAALFGWLWLKERISRGALMGGAIALAGAALLALARADAGQGQGTKAWVGDGLGLAAAFGYAGYLLIVRALGGRASVGAIMLWATLTAGLATLVASVALGQTLLPDSPRGWAILIGLGVLVQAAGQGLIAYGVAKLPLVLSTVLLWAQPLMAAALSWALFGEALGPAAFLGAALILGGVLGVQRTRFSGAKA